MNYVYSLIYFAFLKLNVQKWWFYGAEILVELARLEPARVESVKIESSAKHQFPNWVEPANLAELSKSSLFAVWLVALFHELSVFVFNYMYNSIPAQMYNVVYCTNRDSSPRDLDKITFPLTEKLPSLDFNQSSLAAKDLIMHSGPATSDSLSKALRAHQDYEPR